MSGVVDVNCKEPWAVEDILVGEADEESSWHIN